LSKRICFKEARFGKRSGTYILRQHSAFTALKCVLVTHSSCVVLDLVEDTISMETLQTSIVPDHSYGCKVKFRSLYLNWIRMCIFLRCGGDKQFQEVPMESESLQPPAVYR